MVSEHLEDVSDERPQFQVSDPMEGATLGY